MRWTEGFKGWSEAEVGSFVLAVDTDTNEALIYAAGNGGSRFEIWCSGGVESTEAGKAACEHRLRELLQEALNDLEAGE